METAKTQKVFVQYQYCPLCRSNHKKGKKHFLTERHQQIVGNIIKKFSGKIKSAKYKVTKPVVKDVTWAESAKKFWCYFCQDDIDLHKLNHVATGDCVVEQGGLLEHIVRDDHIEKAKRFLKENRIDMKRTSEFVISSIEYITFLGSAEQAISQFFAEKNKVLNKMSANIRAQNMLRQQIVSLAMVEQSVQQVSEYQREPEVAHLSRTDYGIDDGHRRKTAQAFGEGLTVIDRSKEDDSVGNMYTNAVPPWLRRDSEKAEDGTAEIGPTMKDLERHRKLEKKAKLPACRVGAKFDRNSGQSESWMPSFGGVWHHSRRSDSAKQFQRRQLGHQKMSRPNPPSILARGDKTSTFHLPPPVCEIPDDVPSTRNSHTVFGARPTATASAPWSTHATVLSGSFDTTASSSHFNTNFPKQMVEDTRILDDKSSFEDVGTTSLPQRVKPYVSKRKRQCLSQDANNIPQHFPAPESSWEPNIINNPWGNYPQNTSFQSSYTSNNHSNNTELYSHTELGVNNNFNRNGFTFTGLIQDQNFQTEEQHGGKNFFGYDKNPPRFSTSKEVPSSSFQQPLHLIATPLLDKHKKDST